MIYDIALVLLGSAIFVLFILTAPKDECHPPYHHRHYYSDDPTDHS